MIIEIKVSNYRSIDAEQTISFVADRSVQLPDNLIKQEGFRLLKAVGIYGANAAGKSNYVKAIKEARRFIIDSATRLNEGDRIDYSEGFQLDSSEDRLGSGFEISFILDSYIYRYGLSCQENRVEKEYLYSSNISSKSEKLVFERLLNHNHNIYNWEFGKEISSDSVLIRERTRSNGSVLSTGSRENIDLFKIIYSYFVSKLMTFNMSSGTDALLSQSIIYYTRETDILQNVIAIMKSVDLGIDNIYISNNSSYEIDIRKRFNGKIINETIEACMYAENRMKSIIVERQDRMGKLQSFDLQQQESEGTKRLFSLSGPLLKALTDGSLIVIDELDASMHPLMTRALIELFQSPEVNKNGAQLLFTTHDTGLLDNQLFRRDQIWLAEKRNNASEYFSLADIVPPPRNTEAYLKNYMAGRYGGTPQIHLPLRFALRKKDE